MQRTIPIPVTDEMLAALRHDPATYAAELRLAAAAKLYELGRISQETAAVIAGLSRRDFVLALGSLGVSPFQDTPESLADELERG
jgi:predicted HTH domain antitoxin